MGYYSSTKEEVLRQKNSFGYGLTQSEAARRLEVYGTNEIKEEKQTSPITIFLRQFNDVVVYILLFAVVLSFAVKEFLDAYVILAILIFNSLLGFFQEYKAEKAVQLLKKLTTLKAIVLRDNKPVQVDSSALVPGDVILIEAGTKVPADVRLIESKNIKTNEASLTGESLPCNKQLEPISEDTVLAERDNMLFAGTIVVRGVGKGVVVETGMKTEIGNIARLVQEVEETKTPLQIKLQQLGKFLGMLTIGICALVLAIGVIRDLGFVPMLLTAVSLAVAAIPEGLPAVVTICLALSVQHMIKKNALIKKLKSIETLGDITTICSDKTGTLTKSEMTVKQVFVNNKLIDVGGQGYTTDGTFTQNGKEVDQKELKMLLEIAISCNNATKEIGDPTERALVFAALKGGVQKIDRVDEIPFDSDKKYMVTVHDGFSYSKGAPEVILDMCTHLYSDGKTKMLNPSDRKKILEQNHAMAEDALRVLAMAYKKGGKMHFVGLMGMIDPPKKGVKEALALCDHAGIRAVMITGDHPVTATAIAHQVGMHGKVVTGKELSMMDDKKLREVVKVSSIYARTSSEHKVRILRALQENGEIVAMTGDGINDAPALKKADVGIAMSQKGTDVSRDASDMVLTDDNFASIVSAIKQGRIVYDNIKKFVNYLLSANTAEVGVIIVSLLFGLPLPLLPIHILWVNLMTDSWPALALGVDKPVDDVMKRKPRNPKEHFLKGLTSSIFATGVIGTVIILGFFYFTLKKGVDIGEARTIALSTMIVFELFRVYGCRSDKAFMKQMFSNKWLNIAVLFSLSLQLLIMYTPLNIAFRLIPLGLVQWMWILLAGFSGFILLEVWKLLVVKAKHI